MVGNKVWWCYWEVVTGSVTTRPNCWQRKKRPVRPWPWGWGSQTVPWALPQASLNIRASHRTGSIFGVVGAVFSESTERRPALWWISELRCHWETKPWSLHNLVQIVVRDRSTGDAVQNFRNMFVKMLRIVVKCSGALCAASIVVSVLPCVLQLNELSLALQMAAYSVLLVAQTLLLLLARLPTTCSL